MIYPNVRFSLQSHVNRESIYKCFGAHGRNYDELRNSLSICEERHNAILGDADAFAWKVLSSKVSLRNLVVQAVGLVLNLMLANILAQG